MVAKLAVLFHSELIQTLALYSTSTQAQQPNELFLRKTVGCVEQIMQWLQIVKPSGILWFIWEVVKIQMTTVFSDDNSECTISDLCEHLLETSAILTLCLRLRLPMDIVRVFGFAHATSTLAVAIGVKGDDQLSSDDLVVYMTNVSSLPRGCLSHQYMGSIQGIQHLLGHAQSQPLSVEEREQLLETLRWQLKKFSDHFHPISTSLDCQGTVNMDDLIELASGLNINELDVLLTGETTDGPGGLPFSLLGILPSQSMRSSDDNFEMAEAELEEKRDKEKETQQREALSSSSDSDICTGLRQGVHSISLMDEAKFRQDVLPSLSSKADVETCRSDIWQLMSKETSKLRVLRCEKDELLRIQENPCHAAIVRATLRKACAEKQAEIDLSLSVTQNLEKFNDLLEELEFRISQTVASSAVEHLQVPKVDISVLLSQILLTGKGNADILTGLFVRARGVCTNSELLSLSCQIGLADRQGH